MLKRMLVVFLALCLLTTGALADSGEGAAPTVSAPAATLQVITMDTSNVPAIPAGSFSAEVIFFTGNKTYAVYSAPDTKSIRGAKGKARVSTNGWIQVFGCEGDRLLVQYDIKKGQRNRIGYISSKALPEGVTVPELQFTQHSGVINYDVEATDDPLVNQTALAKLKENTKVTCLGTMGEWTYIEAAENGTRFRGFVPTACLSDTVNALTEARQAIVGSWKLYVGSTINASRITFREDGSMTGISTLESGREIEWSGTWSISEYDSARDRYWNDCEFELTLARGTNVELYGLRICRQAAENGENRYALILSDGSKTSGMVLFE